MNKEEYFWRVLIARWRSFVFYHLHYKCNRKENGYDKTKTLRLKNCGPFYVPVVWFHWNLMWQIAWSLQVGVSKLEIPFNEKPKNRNFRKYSGISYNPRKFWILKKNFLKFNRFKSQKFVFTIPITPLADIIKKFVKEVRREWNF